jgi:predicted nucleic acid-binding protein
MSIVSNASPLIHLARIGQLELLHHLYGEVFVPESVWEEVVVKGAGQPGAAMIERAGWVRRKSVANLWLVRVLRRELEVGEAEAIALALEIGAELLLMDDRVGRKIAQFLGVRCVGTVGVLMEAKKKGLIPLVKPSLDALRVSGFYLGDELYERVLRDVEET